MAAVGSARLAWWRRYELPTWGLAVGIYLGWAASTFYFHDLPLWLGLPLGAWLVAWHGSLQHEASHGHPTRDPRINALLAGWALWLWLPYGIYRDEHLAHHRTPELTDPLEDNESYWVDDVRWQQSGRLRRALLWINATLAGRLLLGPLLLLWSFAGSELGRLRRGDRSHLRHWAWHLVAVTAVLTWVVGVCGIPLWLYVVGFAYPGLSLSLIRSYAEHRPAPEREHRTAIIEAGPLLSLLFLHNNLHALHHRRPHLPWFDYPREYRRRRAELLAGNGGYFHRGYGEIFARYALRPRRSPHYSAALQQHD